MKIEEIHVVAECYRCGKKAVCQNMVLHDNLLYIPKTLHLVFSGYDDGISYYQLICSECLMEGDEPFRCVDEETLGEKHKSKAPSK